MAACCAKALLRNKVSTLEEDHGLLKVRKAHCNSTE
jgi:hypothetical protein